MHHDQVGNMILEMAKARDEMAKNRNALLGSDEGDSKERADQITEQITGLHEGMRIAIRHFDNIIEPMGLNWTTWKQMKGIK